MLSVGEQKHNKANMINPYIICHWNVQCHFMSLSLAVYAIACSYLSFYTNSFLFGSNSWRQLTNILSYFYNADMFCFIERLAYVWQHSNNVADFRTLFSLISMIQIHMLSINKDIHGFSNEPCLERYRKEYKVIVFGLQIMWIVLRDRLFGVVY